MRTTLLRYLFILALLPLLTGCALEAAGAGASLPAVSDQLPLVQTSSPAAQEPVELPATTDLQTALVDVYQEANSSVVYIAVANLGSGSGFVYSDDGYIITNNHVVQVGRRFEVVFATGDRLEAALVGADADSDLAVLKVGELPAGVEPLELAVDALQIGQFVVAIGSPYGEEGSMTMGIISALGRSLAAQREAGTGSTYSLPEVIQTDTPINPGNSGGPLLNLDGEVVGITYAIASTTGTNSGVGYAIPVQAVAQVVPILIANGSYDYPYMGAAFDGELTLADLEVYGLSQTQGAYVVAVTPGSPAAQAGLTAANGSTGRGGDLVTAIDGSPIAGFDDLNSYLVFHTAPGQTIALTILRGGDELVLPLTLSTRP
jgi:S1-C subfamily serine protease